MSATRVIMGVVSAGGWLMTAVGATSAVYLTAIGFGAARQEWIRTRGPEAAGQRDTTFRILVPAHDEEGQIAETLSSLASIAYPDDQVEVHVVADNCSDCTAAIARAHGAIVHERNEPSAPGKGPALAWLLDRLPVADGRESAVVIVDADTVVDANLLDAFDAAIHHGASVVQGFYRVKDADASAETGLRSAAFAVRHFVRPAGRTQLGGSSSLYGNGMAFREEVARAFRWSSHLTEDLDMGLRLLLAGHTVSFAPEAVVFGEMPNSRAASVCQHERWETGRRAIGRTFVPRLLQAAITGRHRKRWAYLDAAIDIALPPFGTLLAMSSTGGALVVVFGHGVPRVAGGVIGVTSVGLLGFHVILALFMTGAPAAVYAGLVEAPANIVWKLRLLARTRRDQPTTWVRTARTGEGAHR